MVKITKELFLETIEVLRLQREKDDKCHEAWKVLLPDDFVTGYDNHLVIAQLTKILQLAFKDEGRDSWIDYYIWELNFGSKYTEGCAKYKNGLNIDISTPEKLYEFLVKEKKSK